MSQRINISIQDELHEKLNLYKTRLNVSKICQNAIEKAVKNEEIEASSADGNEKMLEQVVLRHEEMEKKLEQDMRSLGLKRGIKDAYTMSVIDYIKIAHKDFVNLREDAGISLENTFQEFVSPETMNLWGNLWDELKKINDIDEDLGSEYEDLLPVWLLQEIFFNGWLEGVIYSWEKIKEYIKKNQDNKWENVKKERIEERKKLQLKMKELIKF